MASLGSLPEAVVDGKYLWHIFLLSFIMLFEELSESTMLTEFFFSNLNAFVENLC